MTIGQAKLTVQALIAILPMVILAIREGRIKSAAQDAVLTELIAIHKARVAAAKAAMADASRDKAAWER